MGRRRQSGATAVLLLAVFILVLVGLMASYGLSRITTGGDDRGTTRANLEAAAAALDQFVATALRLPCPADPTLDTGEEVRSGAVCAAAAEQGAVPWKTLGLRREQSFDAWGRKISYRVYTGTRGSLTQDNGATMVHCDTVEPSVGATTGNGASEGRCVEHPDPYQRSTRDTEYLEDKGLSLSDAGRSPTSVPYVGYVLVSHGQTGLGAWTASGVRNSLPAGDERSNTLAAGPFTIKAFSNPDTSATNAQHFDDLLVYRTIPDLMKSTGLQARDWPELTVATSAITFDAATIGAATGTTPSPDQSLGTVVDFGSAVVSGFAGGTATDVAYDEHSGRGGIGVAGSGSRMSSSVGEWLRIDFLDAAERFGVTLNHFGWYDLFFFGRFTERVEFRFYRAQGLATPILVHSVTKSACNADGGIASFTIAVGTLFDRVEIQPQPSIPTVANFNWITDLALSEVVACPGTTGQCRTNLWHATNACS